MARCYRSIKLVSPKRERSKGTLPHMRICDTQIGAAMLDTARKQLSLIAIFHIVGYKHCLKTSFLRTTEEVCGTTRPHRWRRETWWWNEHVGEVITAKRQAFKAWKTGKGTRASYHAAKRIARRAVHHARQETDKEVYKNIGPKSSELYRLANQFRKENADVVGDKPVKNDAGEMSVSDDSKQKAWLEHYQRLLNADFDWDPNHLSDESSVEGPPIPITIDMVKKAISQMKAGKAPGQLGIVVEMIRAADDMGASMIRDLAAAIIRDGKVPTDWEQSFIVCLYKGKGDAFVVSS